MVTSEALGPRFQSRHLPFLEEHLLTRSELRTTRLKEIGTPMSHYKYTTIRFVGGFIQVGDLTPGQRGPIIYFTLNISVPLLRTGIRLLIFIFKTARVLISAAEPVLMYL